MRVADNRTGCEWAQVKPVVPAPRSKIGLALETLGKSPIHGLRHAPTETTSGWYIWCGSELSADPDFFSPLHIEHIPEYLPQVAEYLDLPPGYRFLIDGQDFEDIWFDATLLEGPASP